MEGITFDHQDGISKMVETSYSELRPETDNAKLEALGNHALAVNSIAAYVFNAALSNNWIDPLNLLGTVALRSGVNSYYLMPSNGPNSHLFHSMLSHIRCEAALAITSDVVQALTRKMVPRTAEIPLGRQGSKSVLRVQVLENLEDYQSIRRAQKAAFFRQDGLLLIWGDEALSLEEQALDLEERMVSFIWRSVAPKMKVEAAENKTIKLWKREQTREQGNLAGMTIEGSSNSIHGSNPDEISISAIEAIPTAASLQDISRLNKVSSSELEDQKDVDSFLRPTESLASFQSGLAIVISILMFGLLTIRKILVEYFTDRGFMRFALLIPIPFQFILTLFTCFTLVTAVFQLVGPINQMRRNSRYYSGVASRRLTHNLPHITIQMPVYKENLETVIAPSITSLREAVRVYELQGGTANILISEDGLKVLPLDQRKARLDYYDKMDISWVARPPHGETFQRRGRFKKASNLNFTCQLAMQVEQFVQKHYEADETSFSISKASVLARDCVAEKVRLLHPEAEAKGDVRIGDLILLVDSDTRVPEDCLLDSASEMAQCPDVGILQHSSGVLLSPKPNYFEKGIAFFTTLVNFGISFSISCGQVAPFMGHNAFLRWSALQEVMRTDEEGNVLTWADDMVSEDFDMALRLIIKGYTVRWATYSRCGFQEGVSLTFVDEINRWQKYAYGASELAFNPITKWFTRGPLAKNFRSFLWSPAPTFYKFNACAYIFSYYAISVALPLTIGLSIAEGWFIPYLDPTFLTSFKIFVFVAVLFFGLNPLAIFVSRVRARDDSMGHALVNHIKWLPFLFIFFGSLPYHLTTALLSHILGINMTWSATVKEVGDSHFFVELPIILKHFWKTLVLCLGVIGGFAILATPLLPIEWQVISATTLFPPILLCSLHVLAPFLLDPALLRFSY